MYVSAAARTASARNRESSSAAKFDDRQMLAAFDVAHRESDLFRVARGSTRSMRPSRPRLESLPLPYATRPEVLRCLSGKPHVRPSRVVPDHVQTKLTTHRAERRRNKKASRTFLLHRSNEPFDDCDARRFSDPAVSRPDVTTLAPRLETTAPELPALVRDGIARVLAVCASGSLEKALHLDGRGALRKDRESHADSGKLIDRHRNPPTERPALRCGEGKPRHPESGASRYGALRSTCHVCPGYLATTRRRRRSVWGSSSGGPPRSRTIRLIVVAPRCSPTRASTCAMRS
jgi:hypothetical protein